MLSPTYRVPVLYFALRWNNYPGPIGLDAVYQYVVPEQYMKELKSVGIMGGISFGVGALQNEKDQPLSTRVCVPQTHVS